MNNSNPSITDPIEIENDAGDSSLSPNPSSHDTVGNVKFISTGGGPYIGGSVDIHDGDFVGRDKNIFIRTLNVLIGKNSAEADSKKSKQELDTLLKEVKRQWVDGVLAKSVYASLLIEINKEQVLQFVDDPWGNLIHLPNEADRITPIATPISKIFEESQYSLLILGPPGSGKTTTLLETTLYAIEQVTADQEKPIPVVLHLSTWTKEINDFERWIVVELSDKYGIPHKRAQAWIDDGSLLFLLDGLNEVHPDFRSDCVHAINRYLQKRGPTGIVICSRLEEYKALNVKLKLRKAVLLHSLSDQQLDEYLAAGGLGLSGLRSSLQSSSELRELARLPLMLNIMSTVYTNEPLGKLENGLNGSVTDPVDHLFSQYIKRIFEPIVGQSRKEFSREQTLSRLSWLARQMSSYDQSVFSIEGIQPTWLSNHWHQWLYSVGSRLIAGLALFLAGWIGYGLAVAIAVLLAQKPTDLDELRLGPAYGAGFAVSFLLASILAIKLKNGLTILLTCTTISVMLLFIVPLPEGSKDPKSLLPLGIGLGLLFGLPGGLAGMGFCQGDIVKILDTLEWNWRRCLRGLVFGLASGLVIGFSVGWLFGQSSGDLWADTMIIGLPIGFIGILFYGMSRSEHIENRLMPNQGIHRSGRNALNTILRVLLTCILLLGIPIGIVDENGARTGIFFGWALGTILGLPISIGFGLYAGGATYIQHGILRMILFLDKRIPWDLANFLNFSTEIALLRRVGGQYLFVHMLFLKYIASLGKQG